MLTNIPLFFINTELLVPKILRKRGIAPYLLSLTILAAGFLMLQVGMKSYLLGCTFSDEMKHLTHTLLFVFFVTAVSTGYGLVTYMVSQEKIRQQEHEERLKSELSFLRSQISPHFIFNILNSIVYLIRSKSPRAEPVTIELSELMRYMLYESADAQIPLEKELDYLKNYIDLQRIRFEDDVDIRFQMEGEGDGQIIEPMLMIPFVENAFKHGVGLVRDPQIDINIRYDERALTFVVRNKVPAGPDSDKDNNSGIGLPNVKRRLELLYPGSHTLEINTEGEWFTVQLQLQFSYEHRMEKAQS